MAKCIPVLGVLDDAEDLAWFSQRPGLKYRMRPPRHPLDEEDRQQLGDNVMVLVRHNDDSTVEKLILGLTRMPFRKLTQGELAWLFRQVNQALDSSADEVARLPFGFRAEDTSTLRTAEPPERGAFC